MRAMKIVLLVTLFVAICSLNSGCTYFAIREKERQVEAYLADRKAADEVKGQVVYASKDIYAGSLLMKDNLEEKEIQASKIPIDAFTNMQFVIGKKAKYDIPAGNIISQHDILVKLPPKPTSAENEAASKSPNTSDSSRNHRNDTTLQ